jgi:hypothetical protein
MECWCVLQLKLSAAAAGTSREKLPVYTSVPAADTNGTVNGRFNSFNEQSVTRASPRANSLKPADS